jgi:hypothetical protein
MPCDAAREDRAYAIDLDGRGTRMMVSYSAKHDGKEVMQRGVAQPG